MVIYPGTVVICRISPKGSPEIKPGQTFHVRDISLNGGAIYLLGFYGPFSIDLFEYVYTHDSEF